METDAMELAVHSFSADVNGNGVLELHGYWVQRALATFNWLNKQLGITFCTTK